MSDFNDEAADSVPADPQEFPDLDESEPQPDPTTGTAEGEAPELPEPEPRSGGRLSGLRDALTSTEPSPDLSDVESPWNPDEGGLTRIYRGIQKATNSDGMPAWADIAIGAVEEYVARLEGETTTGNTADEPADGPPDMGGEVTA